MVEEWRQAGGGGELEDGEMKRKELRKEMLQQQINEVGGKG